MNDSFVEHDGIRLAIRDYGGAGAPFLLLPGAERTLLDLDRLAVLLAAEGHRVVTMDLRNHGLSGTGTWTWPLVVSDVEAVIAATGLQRPVIVGHSLGGMVASMCGGVPGLAGAVVNLDGIGFGQPEQYVGYSRRRVLLIWQVIDLLSRPQYKARSTPAAKLDRLKTSKLAYIGSWGHSPQAALEVWERILHRDSAGGYTVHPPGPQFGELMRSVQELDMFALYRAATCPVLIVDCPRTVEGMFRPLRKFFAAERVGLARDYAELVRERDNVTVVTLDADHPKMMQTHAAEIAAIVRPLATARRFSEHAAATRKG